MIYRPKSVPSGDSLPYGGSQREFPYGRESTAVVFSDEGDGFWGFLDPEWVEDGKVRGQLRINIASPTGQGGLGGENQTASWWVGHGRRARADRRPHPAGPQVRLRGGRPAGARADRSLTARGLRSATSGSAAP